MDFPAGFDPLAVTSFSLNGSNADPELIDRAEVRLKKLFPNAESRFFAFHEEPEALILAIDPWQGLSADGIGNVIAAVEIDLKRDADI